MLGAGKQGLMYALRITSEGARGTSRRQGANDTEKRDHLLSRNGRQREIIEDTVK